MRDYTHSKPKSKILGSQNDRETVYAIKSEGRKIMNLNEIGETR